MQEILIPKPLQITMDDIGWFCGKDGREKMEPARTGITRRHCAEDYEVINELGRRLGMKINCAIVMGEWDPDNRLKNIPGLSVYGKNWDNASYYDAKEAKRCVDVINSSEYIDIALHGLHHSYYVEGEAYNNTDYYMNGVPVPEDEIRARVDACYELMEYHGFKKKINSFIPPNFTYRTFHLSKILKDYNIQYISTRFMRIPDETDLQDVIIEDGVIVVDRNNNLIRFNEMESNLDEMPVVSGIFGCHWANICHKNPAENNKLIDSWVNYFEKCKKVFGTIISESIAFCATQTVYEKHSEVSYDGTVFTIDLKDIPRADGLQKSFCVSAKEPITKWSGCNVEMKEKCADFINYVITPTSKTITLI